MSAPTPAEIAAKLSPTDREALMAMPGPLSVSFQQKVRMAVTHDAPWPLLTCPPYRWAVDDDAFWPLFPLGHEVRAYLEKESRHD